MQDSFHFSVGLKVLPFKVRGEWVWVAGPEGLSSLESQLQARTLDGQAAPGLSWPAACPAASLSAATARPGLCGGRLALLPGPPPASLAGPPRGAQKTAGPVAGREQTWRSRAAAAEVSSPLPPRPQRYEATSSACRRGTWCARRAGSPCSGFPLMERNNSSPTMACRPSVGHCPLPDPLLSSPHSHRSSPTSVCFGGAHVTALLPQRFCTHSLS